MAEITWSALIDHEFERGVDHGVIYTPTAGVYDKAAPWNGLTNVTAAPSGAESNKQYADNKEYVNLLSREMFGATLETFTVPKAFRVHDGVVTSANGLQVTMQRRPIFGLCWRNMKGNAENEDEGYVINLAYGCQAQPSEKSSMTINDGVELATMSFTLSTTPIEIPGYKPSAYLRIDSTDPLVSPEGLTAVENVLYGRGATAARLPLPAELDTLLAA